MVSKKLPEDAAGRAKPAPICKDDLAIGTTQSTGKSILAGLKAKAQHAYSQGFTGLKGARDLTTGNLQAFKESGTAFSSGVMELGNTVFADARLALQATKEDVKDLRSLKSLADVVSYQSKVVQRTLDATVALGFKNVQAVEKLTKETVTPLSKRVGEVATRIRKKT